jgi:predicted Zn-ribbon and HTH transcriptional regulator
MYLKLESSQITLRISQQEAQNLLESKKLVDKIRLATDSDLVIELTTDCQQSGFNFDAQKLKFCAQLTREQIEDELAGRPSKQGILVEAENNDSLPLYIQIDLKRKKN